MNEDEARKRVQQVLDDTERAAERSLPGQRAALKPGELHDHHQLTQHDEHRDPDRPIASPPEPHETVADHLRASGGKE